MTLEIHLKKTGRQEIFTRLVAALFLHLINNIVYRLIVRCEALMVAVETEPHHRQRRRRVNFMAISGGDEFIQTSRRPADSRAVRAKRNCQTKLPAQGLLSAYDMVLNVHRVLFVGHEDALFKDGSFDLIGPNG